MSETPKSKDRIPFESLSDSSDVSSWSLPSMDAQGRVVRSAQRDKKKKGASADVVIESVSKKTKPKPLTAEELQQITEQARKDGFQRGLHEGTEQGIREGTKTGEKAGHQRAYMEAKKEIEALQYRLRTLATRLFDPMQQQDQQIENILVDVILNLSKRVISSEVSFDPSVLLKTVHQVLGCLPKDAKNVRVFLNDKDADLVEGLVPENQRNWRVQRDNSQASGGCIVESDSSLIDFSVGERIATFLDKLDTQGVAAELPPLPDYQSSSEVDQNELTEPQGSERGAALGSMRSSSPEASSNQTTTSENMPEASSELGSETKSELRTSAVIESKTEEADVPSEPDTPQKPRLSSRKPSVDSTETQLQSNIPPVDEDTQRKKGDDERE